jgi:hypothetical protein
MAGSRSCMLAVSHTELGGDYPTPLRSVPNSMNGAAHYAAGAPPALGSIDPPRNMPGTRGSQAYFDEARPACSQRLSK